MKINMKIDFGLKNIRINYSNPLNVWATKSNKIYTAAQKAARRVLVKAAYRIFRDAQSTIERANYPSDPGTPPHTRRGMLARSMRYRVDYTVPDALIGPVGSVIAGIGELHEFGGIYKRGLYPPRPYMGPALERELSNFSGDFKGSIGE